MKCKERRVAVIVLRSMSLPKAHDIKWVILLWFPSPCDTSTTVRSSHTHDRGKISVFAVLHEQNDNQISGVQYSIRSLLDLAFPMAALSTACPKLYACTYLLRTPYSAGLLSGRVEKKLVRSSSSACFNHDYHFFIILPWWYYCQVRLECSKYSRGPLRQSQPGCRCRA